MSTEIATLTTEQNSVALKVVVAHIKTECRDGTISSKVQKRRKDDDQTEIY